MATSTAETIAAVASFEKRPALAEHIAFFGWTKQSSQEAIESAMTELRKLKDKVPGIVDLYCGPNRSDRAKGYTHGLVVRFTDQAALEAYGPHPEHQRIVRNFITPILADLLVFEDEFRDEDEP